MTRKNIRELGLRRTPKVKQIEARKKTVRTSTLLKINFNAEEKSEMIKWMNYELSSPPMLKKTVTTGSNRISTVTQSLTGILLSSSSQFTRSLLKAV